MSISRGLEKFKLSSWIEESVGIIHNSLNDNLQLARYDVNQIIKHKEQ